MNRRARFTLYISFVVSRLYSQAFTNVAPAVGITGGYGMISFFGAGVVSFVDCNQDGLDDLTFCTMAEQPMKFYNNTGSGFTLVDPPYADNTLETRYILWADIDNDGDLDLFQTNIKRHPMLLPGNQRVQNMGAIFVHGACTIDQ